MTNLELEAKYYSYMLIEVLLKNIKDSAELKKELEELHEKYCKNIIN